MRLTVTVTPDPFNAELLILIHSDVTFNAVISLINANKSVVRMTGIPLQTGPNSIPLKNLIKYASGSYLLEIKLLNGELLKSIGLTKA